MLAGVDLSINRQFKLHLNKIYKIILKFPDILQIMCNNIAIDQIPKLFMEDFTMGFSDSLAGAMDNTRSYELSKEMTIDEIFEIVKVAGIPEEITGAFDLKKGLFGKKIIFNGPKGCTGELTVKGAKAKLTKVTKQAGSGVSVGGVPVGGGGVKGALEKTNLENAFFKALADALGAVLK